MRKLTDGDLAKVIGSTIEGYCIEAEKSGMDHSLTVITTAFSWGGTREANM